MIHHEVIMVDEGEGYWYPSPELIARRQRAFWESPCDPDVDGGLWGRRTEWEKRATRFIQEQACFVPLPPYNLE